MLVVYDVGEPTVFVIRWIIIFSVRIFDRGKVVVFRSFPIPVDGIGDLFLPFGHHKVVYILVGDLDGV